MTPAPTSRPSPSEAADRLREALTETLHQFGEPLFQATARANVLIAGPLAPLLDRITAAEADRDRLATELAEARAEKDRMRAALGCHILADAYRETFPDNDQDAAYLRKSETWWRLMSRCAVPVDDPLRESCSIAAMSMPEVAAHCDAIVAKVASEFGA